MFNLGCHGSHNATLSISYGSEILESVEIERLISKKNAALFFYENMPHSVNIIKEVLNYFECKYGASEYDNFVFNSIDDNIINYREVIKANYYQDIPHHLTHSSSAFYQSSYKEALVFSFDGGSDEGFFCVYHAIRGKDFKKLYSGQTDYAISYMTPAHFINEIKREDDIYKGNLVYSGKLMGYAGYGNLEEKYVEDLIDFYKSNTYDNIPHAVSRFVSKFKKHSIIDWNTRVFGSISANLACTNQYVFEKLFREEVDIFLEQYPDLPIVLTGGCGLNIINNTLLSLEREVFVPPNPNDVGLAVGALCHILKPQDPVDTTYLGSQVWDRNKLSSYLSERFAIELDYSIIVKDILEGKIVGTVIGRSEHGPRALGNRSIICDATNPKMKDILNYKIKNREGYRPFAPVVREQDVFKYFEWDKPSRWMSFCPKVREEYKELLKSVTHIDGTSRVQTVTYDQHPTLYLLLTEMEKQCSHGILINTSFNVDGKPILNTYNEAFSMFDSKDIHGMIIENYYFRK